MKTTNFFERLQHFLLSTNTSSRAINRERENIQNDLNSRLDNVKKEIAKVKGEEEKTKQQVIVRNQILTAVQKRLGLLMETC